MTMKCISHHYACDCREEKIQGIFISILLDHEIKIRTKYATEGTIADKKILATVECDCPICMKINELYSNLGRVTLG